MSYKSSSIYDIVTKLNQEYFLPAIQREYVWQPDQIISLMDSIMRGYPINTFLFWEVQDENYGKWDVYQFIQNYDPQNSHNELRLNKDGLKNLYLVLDGQQRLTSLNVALCGSYNIHKKGTRRDRLTSWSQQQLYLNLFKDGDTAASDDNVEIEATYDFRFWDENILPDFDIKHYWFKVSRIMRETDSGFDRFVEEEANVLEDKGIPREIRTIFKTNLNRLYRMLKKEDLVAYHLEKEQDLDRVLDIFARTNMGGTKLSKSDLLLSMVTAKWNDMNAREEIHNFVDNLNQNLLHKNSFDKDFILKTALVLTDLPIKYEVKNFKVDNLELMRIQWTEIKCAIENAVKLVNTFGINRDTLTSANALIPIIYYTYKHPKINLQGTTELERRNALNIHKWLIMILLNRVFSGNSDTMLTNIRRVLAEKGSNNDFPVETITAEIRKQGRNADFSSTLDEFLKIEYGDYEDFLALSLLYDEKNWGLMTFHKDHIFPKDAFKYQNLKNLGYTEDRIQRYQQLHNRVGNLQLLLSSENIAKSNGQFENWIVTRDSDFERRHLIPNDPQLLQMEKFEEFIAAREQLIRERLSLLFASQIEMETL